MDRIFFDSDVLLDISERRQPHYLGAVECLNLVADRSVVGATSALVIANMVYVLRRKEWLKTHAFLRGLRGYLEITSMGQAQIDYALSTQPRDFEDTLQWHSALSWQATHLLTRNAVDYPEESSIAVLSPMEYLQLRSA